MGNNDVRRCIGRTKSEERCQRRATSGEYCHLHDPEIAAAAQAARVEARRSAELQYRKGDKLREILDRFTRIAERMGWFPYVQSIDKSDWTHFSLGVKRSTPRGSGGSAQITGVIEVAMGDTVHLSTQQTSFHGTGLDLLFATLNDEFNAIPWLQPVTKADSKTKNASLNEDILVILSRFHQVAVQLLARRENRDTLRIGDEYDVQDLLHALLRSRFDDVRSEEYSPSYAGGSSRIDFLLKREQAAIEVKMASATLRDRALGEQLIVDIQRYQGHPTCKTLFCMVYDPHHNVRNPAGLEGDLSGTAGELEVVVLVIPK